MRQLISGVFAAVAAMTVSAAPASACGGLGLFSSCSPCGQAYVSPCAQSYAPAFTYATGCGGCAASYNYSGSYGGGCGGGCGVSYERLPELSPQYYYVNQGPTYTGPGNFAPYPTYQENAVRSNYGSGYGYGGGGYGNQYYGGGVSYAPRPYYRPWRARVGYGYGVRSGYRYGVGYGVGRGYGIGRAYGVGRGYGIGHGYGVRHGMGYGVARGYGVGRGYGHGGMRRY